MRNAPSSRYRRDEMIGRVVEPAGNCRMMKGEPSTGVSFSWFSVKICVAVQLASRYASMVSSTILLAMDHLGVITMDGWRTSVAASAFGPRGTTPDRLR